MKWSHETERWTHSVVFHTINLGDNCFAVLAKKRVVEAEFRAGKSFVLIEVFVCAKVRTGTYDFSKLQTTNKDTFFLLYVSFLFLPCFFERYIELFYRAFLSSFFPLLFRILLHRTFMMQCHVTCEIVLVGKPLFPIRSKAEFDQRLSAFEKRFWPTLDRNRTGQSSQSINNQIDDSTESCQRELLTALQMITSFCAVFFPCIRR